MKKNVFGRRLKRDKNERKALFKSLLSGLILNQRIETTKEKAKSIRGLAEKLITRAKKKNAIQDVLLNRYLSKDLKKRLVEEIAPRFLEINGGYIRIIKTGHRLSDNAATVIMEFSKKEEKTETDRKRSLRKPKKENEKK